MDTETASEFRHLERHGGAPTDLELYVKATSNLAATIEASGLSGLSDALEESAFDLHEETARFRDLQAAERVRVFAERLQARGSLPTEGEPLLRTVQSFASRLTAGKTGILNFVHGEKLRELAGHLDSGELWLRELSFYSGEYTLDRYSLETFVERLENFLTEAREQLRETGPEESLFGLLKPMSGNAIASRMAGRSARFGELVEALEKYTAALRSRLS